MRTPMGRRAAPGRSGCTQRGLPRITYRGPRIYVRHLRGTSRKLDMCVSHTLNTHLRRTSERRSVASTAVGVEVARHAQPGVGLTSGVAAGQHLRLSTAYSGLCRVKLRARPLVDGVPARWIGKGRTACLVRCRRAHAQGVRTFSRRAGRGVIVRRELCGGGVRHGRARGAYSCRSRSPCKAPGPATKHRRRNRLSRRAARVVRCAPETHTSTT